MLPPCKVILPVLMMVCFGCRPQSTSSPTYQVTTHTQQAIPASTQPTAVRSSTQYIGRNSCTATACHGQPQAETVSWRNAYTLWESTDPHRRAFDVLYTERSVGMYRKLTEDQNEHVDEGGYLHFLETKCIGCHATPPAGSNSTGELMRQTSPAAYWQGVSCESCHGPASNWLGQHYSLAWPESGDVARSERTSQVEFRDQRALDQRATTCLQCHHGPQRIGTQLYDVNHDLIAAGHPRLQFELHAYLTNLPKHWDEGAEVKRYAATKSQQPSFHFDTWQAGQVHHGKQIKSLQQSRTKLAGDAGEWAEFANHDCRMCHHSFGDTTYPSAAAGMLQSLNAKLAHQSTTTIAERAEIIEQLLNNSRTSDQAIEAYLAAAAFAGDLPKDKLSAELTQLQQALARQAGASPYDLPGKFKRQQPELEQAVNSLLQALQRISP